MPETNVLLVADSRLADALEPSLKRAGFVVERAAEVVDESLLAGRSFVIAPLKHARGERGLLAVAPRKTVCVLLPPGRDAEREALVAAGAADAFASPVRASLLARRLTELAASVSIPAPAPEPAPIEVILDDDGPGEPSPWTTAPDDAAPASLASALFEVHRWPAALPSEESARAELVRRARASVAEIAGIAETSAALGEVYRSLSRAELEALRSESPSPEEALFAIAAAHRLVVKQVAAEAPAPTHGEKLVEVDDALLDALRARGSELQAKLEAAVEQALRTDAAAFRRIEPARAGLGRAARELENARRRARGEALLDLQAPLDAEAIATTGPALPRVVKPTPQVGQVTIHDAKPLTPQKRNRRALVALVVVALAVVAVHVFVLGTFQRAPPPRDRTTRLPPVAGVTLEKRAGKIEARLPPTPEVSEKAAAVEAQVKQPFMVLAPDGQPVGFQSTAGFFPAPGFESLAPAPAPPAVPHGP